MTNDTRCINTVGSVSGEGHRIVQIYAPGATDLRSVDHFKVAGLAPFSVDWLIYSQESVPFFGREAELEAINAFLEAPQGFCWWVIVGEGGTGKSRLALEAIRRLPEGWTGGFLASESITTRDAAAWEPKANTLWVVDYAAAHYESLRGILATWAQLSHASPFKVRWLLLERGLSHKSGWWSELTGAMDRDTAIVKATLYTTPLSLPPLAEHARDFLTEVCKRVDGNAQQTLRANLERVSDEWLMTQSQGGNPLLLQLLTANLLSGGADAVSAAPVDAGGLVERHLGRELKLLEKKCQEAGLDFRSMLRVLFATTSLYPVNIPQDFDRLVLDENDIQSIKKEPNKKVRSISFSELRAMGFDIEQYRRPTLENLATITNVDDVEEYLSILDEAGMARASRYSVQPDLVGEALIDLVLNSPNARSSLKRRRGEFKKDSVVKLIDGCLALSIEDCTKNWSRLNDSTITTLSSHLRLTGKSIRYTLVTLRRMNQKRSTKIKFDPNVVFSANTVHPNARVVGHYFYNALQLISQETLDERAASRLVREPHAWVLPYIYFLLDINLLQQAWLGLLICKIEDKTLLSRLTNLGNFLNVIHEPLRKSFSAPSNRGHGLSVQERSALALLVDAAIEFGCSKAYPTMVAVGEKDFTDLYAELSGLLANCSFYVVNHLLGRQETPESRQRVRNGLEVARLVLTEAPTPHIMAIVDRNLALLKVADLPDGLDALPIHSEALEKIQHYAAAEDFTDAIVDVFSLHTNQGDPLASLRIAHSLLSQAPQHLVRGERLVGPLAQTLLQVTDKQDAGGRIGDTLYPLCSTLLATLRAIESKEAIENLVALMTIAVNMVESAPELWQGLTDLLSRARSWMDEGVCSASFIDAILRSAVAYGLMAKEQQVEGSGSGAELPFDLRIWEISPETWQAILHDVIGSEHRDRIETIRRVTVTYRSPRNELFSHSTFPISVKDPAAVREWDPLHFQTIQESLEVHLPIGRPG